MIKLIAIDLDGTLLNSQKEIPEENIRAIKEATDKGTKIVVCTGRPSSGTKPYFDQLGLSEDEFLILNNGCSTYASQGWRLIHHQELSLSDVAELENRCQNFPGVYLTLTSENNYYVLSDHVPEIVQADGDLVFTKVKAIQLQELSKNAEIVFQAMYMGEPSAIDQFEKEVRSDLEKDYSLVRSQDYILEVMPANVTKASALKKLAEDLNCQADQVMAIGDAPNDLEMLSFAGLGIAMGNASQPIKEMADAVTSSCDEAGVAQAIRKYVL
ncbi:Cof-type HAD-IIB family hydrolase [Streptococcus catagoni]|uniref:Cof-type HAD-IIB family hydrolase n=1 Tax=Streptococcus catagoni TaxID=2654874 RepID=UPI00140C8936|nr:Cof-type HAD-IIB family hydrolase [Streptococcus catagoni]